MASVGWTCHYSEHWPCATQVRRPTGARDWVSGHCALTPLSLWVDIVGDVALADDTTHCTWWWTRVFAGPHTSESFAWRQEWRFWADPSSGLWSCSVVYCCLRVLVHVTIIVNLGWNELDLIWILVLLLRGREVLESHVPRVSFSSDIGSVGWTWFLLS